MIFARLLNLEQVVLIEEDVPLLEQPEKVCREVGGRGGGAFREDGFPEAFEFGGFVGADPLDHDCGPGGEHGTGREGVWSCGAGVEFALAFEDGEVFSLDRPADGGDQDGGVLAGVVAGLAEAGEQGGREVFGGNGSGNLNAAGLLECPRKAMQGGDALRLAAVVDPGFRVGRFDAPAGFQFHGFEPCIDRFLAAFGMDAGLVDLEPDVREALAVDAAEVWLVGVEIGRAEPFAGHATFGDRLEIPRRRIHLDGFLLDELRAPIGGPKVAHRLIAGEEERVVLCAVDERRVIGVDFEAGAAATAFREEDVGDIEQGINAGDLVDFLADEVDRLGIRLEDDADSGCGEDFLAGRWGVAAVAVVAALEWRAAIIEIALAAVVAIPGAAVVTAGGGIGGIVGAGWSRRFIGSGLGPCRTEDKTGHQAAQWVFL